MRIQSLSRPARPFASFWFDCDSTLSAIEGVDELTRTLPPEVQKEIAELTEAAMNGTLPLAEVYEQRLAVIAPTRAMLDEVGRLYVEKLVPGAREVVAALRFLGKRVGIASGGLAQVVRVLAKELSIDASDVHAVEAHFDADGRYAGFARESPLWRNGGKLELFASFGPELRPICFVGDGATDLEAKDAVDLFVGYGGVVVRGVVRLGAGAFVMRLVDVLGIALTEAEAARLAREPQFARLLASG